MLAAMSTLKREVMGELNSSIQPPIYYSAAQRGGLMSEVCPQDELNAVEVQGQCYSHMFGMLDSEIRRSELNGNEYGTQKSVSHTKVDGELHQVSREPQRPVSSECVELVYQNCMPNVQQYTINSDVPCSLHW